MLTDRARKSLLPLKLPEGFQSKVVAPRNAKLVTEEKKDVLVCSFLGITAFGDGWAHADI